MAEIEMKDLCKEVGTWLKEKRGKYRDNEQKVLGIRKKITSNKLYSIMQ